MKNRGTHRSWAADVVDRLWRAYAPYQRGRNTTGDLASMLAILILARFAESVEDPEGEFARHWRRAVAEAQVGLSPAKDLRALMWSAAKHEGFPLRYPFEHHAEFLGDDDDSDSAPWTAAFLSVLDERLSLTAAELVEAGELLVERHEQENPSSGGEFHTPRAIVRLMVDLLHPLPGDRILDPACGSGALLAAAAQRIAGPHGVDGNSFEAYATDRSNPRLAMMNMAVHGVHRPVVRASDPVALFRSDGNGQVDRVMTNPPFNLRIKDLGKADWPFGRPPESNAHFAWLQLAWSRLTNRGTAAVIMHPGAARSGTGQEADIRKKMIASGAVMGIIALPTNLFRRTSIPVHIWLLARDKSSRLPADDSDAVLFIDASRLGTRVPRQPRVLTDEVVERIGDCLRTWRCSPSAAPDEPGFSRSVRHEEILRHEGILDPRLYVGGEPEQPTAEHDASRALDELNRHHESAARANDQLWEGISTFERLSSRAAHSRHMPLQDIVEVSARGVGRLFAGPSGSLIRADEYVEGAGIPVVMPKDLTDNGFRTEAIRRISPYKAEGLGRYRIHYGDVVLARRGELGRCAVARVEQEGWVCGTGCFVLRPAAFLDADYLAVYLRSPEARSWLNQHSTGSMTMKTIPLENLRELPVPVPDLETQEAVVDMVTGLNDLELLLRTQLRLTQEIRHSALHGLFDSEGDRAMG